MDYRKRLAFGTGLATLGRPAGGDIGAAKQALDGTAPCERLALNFLQCSGGPLGEVGLIGAYSRILTKTRAGQAKVYVVGYPALLTSTSKSTGLCVGSAPFNTKGRKGLGLELSEKLNAKTRETVKKMNKRFPRLHYVDAFDKESPFIGHELCSAKPYFRALHIVVNQGVSFHPSKEGQEAYVRLISNYVSSHK